MENILPRSVPTEFRPGPPGPASWDFFLLSVSRDPVWCGVVDDGRGGFGDVAASRAGRHALVWQAGTIWHDWRRLAGDGADTGTELAMACTATPGRAAWL